jgi:hypothetical protein
VEDLSPLEIATIKGRILKGGKQLALLVGKDFPVAGDLWPEVNRIHRVIDDNKLNNTWVTMITPDERDVSNCALAFFVSFLQLLILCLVDCIAGRH